MQIDVSCPHCRSAFSLDAASRGRAILCSHCGRDFEVRPATATYVMPAETGFAPVAGDARPRSQSSPAAGVPFGNPPRIESGRAAPTYLTTFDADEGWIGRIVPAIAAAAATGLLTVAARFEFVARAIGAESVPVVVLGRGWSGPAVLFFSLWAIAIVVLRARRSLGHARTLKRSLLLRDRGDRIGVDDVEGWQRHLQTQRSRGESPLVVARLSGALEHFRAQGSPVGLSEFVESQAEWDVRMIDAAYASVRVLLFSAIIAAAAGIVVLWRTPTGVVDVVDLAIFCAGAVAVATLSSGAARRSEISRQRDIVDYVFLEVVSRVEDRSTDRIFGAASAGENQIVRELEKLRGAENETARKLAEVSTAMGKEFRRAVFDAKVDLVKATKDGADAQTAALQNFAETKDGQATALLERLTAAHRADLERLTATLTEDRTKAFAQLEALLAEERREFAAVVESLKNASRGLGDDAKRVCDEASRALVESIRGIGEPAGAAARGEVERTARMLNAALGTELERWSAAQAAARESAKEAAGECISEWRLVAEQSMEIGRRQADALTQLVADARRELATFAEVRDADEDSLRQTIETVARAIESAAERLAASAEGLSQKSVAGVETRLEEIRSSIEQRATTANQRMESHLSRLVESVKLIQNVSDRFSGHADAQLVSLRAVADSAGQAVKKWEAGAQDLRTYLGAQTDQVTHAIKSLTYVFGDERSKLLFDRLRSLAEVVAGYDRVLIETRGVADDLKSLTEDGTLRPFLTELRRSIGELSLSIRSLESRITGESEG